MEGVFLIRGFIIVVILFLVGCTNQENREPIDIKEAFNNQKTVSIFSQLDVPWAITKHNDTFYISERNGFIVSWNEKDNQFKRSPVKTNKPIHQEGEGGFLGIELSLNYEQSHQAFAYHTYQENGKTFNRIILIKNNGESWNETKELLASIPGSAIHNGGRIKIGPDQKLYVTAGDASVAENAQNIHSLSGKILRMNLDGTIPNDNPFRGSYVYSYGHRNPQGIAWDESGTMYSTEHGQSAHDEINIIKVGHNYGWPIIEGNIQQEGMEKPFFHTDDTTWAPSGIQYKDGKLYIATLRGESLVVFNLKNKKFERLKDDFGRIRDVYIEGENIYFISNNLDGRGTPKERDDQLWKANLKELQ